MNNPSLLGQNYSKQQPQQPQQPHSLRSFVLRQSRISSAQLRYLHNELPNWQLPYQTSCLNLDDVFCRQVPRFLEIGFGMGETTALIAAANPGHDYLGIEVHTPGIGALCKQIVKRELSNLRIIKHDAVEVVRDMLPEQSLSGIHIFFPDPWPKKRHHKRRMLQSLFASLLATRLIPGGYILACTDWLDYAKQMLAVFSDQPLLVNSSKDFVARPTWRPLTKFELRGLQLGHEVRNLLFTRRT